MMRLMLTHRDLMNLVRGTSPSFEAMDYPLVKSHFEYSFIITLPASLSTLKNDNFIKG